MWPGLGSRGAFNLRERAWADLRGGLAWLFSNPGHFGTGRPREVARVWNGPVQDDSLTFTKPKGWLKSYAWFLFGEPKWPTRSDRSIEDHHRPDRSKTFRVLVFECKPTKLTDLARWKPGLNAPCASETKSRPMTNVQFMQDTIAFSRNLERPRSLYISCTAKLN